LYEEIGIRIAINKQLACKIILNKERNDMSKENDISQLEDEILNALNSILMLCYGNDIYKDVEKEITRIVTVLEKKKLINKRLGFISNPLS
jgi:uncharacterized metal-binding protein